MITYEHEIRPDKETCIKRDPMFNRDFFLFNIVVGF